MVDSNPVSSLLETKASISLGKFYYKALWKKSDLIFVL